MNDKEKLLRDYVRMCSLSHCSECLIGKNAGKYTRCMEWISKHPSQSVEYIEEWAKEHPVKTRQDVFLDHYPNAEKWDGALNICPQKVDTTAECSNNMACTVCRNEYWSQEVEE